MLNVVIVIPRGKLVLSSITGAVDLLTRSNHYWMEQGNRARMKIDVAGFTPELKLNGGMFSIFPRPLNEVREVDLIIIPAIGNDYENVIHANADLINWVKEKYKEGAELASICTGAFLLAATGILNGRSCSTHWNAADVFRQMFPAINLQPDKLIIAEPGIYTNGGAYSFLHFLLFLVEKYFDRDTAIHCSKVFQVDMDRTAQSPFFIFQGQKNHGDEMVSRAQDYIEQNLVEKISFEDLSGKLAVSRRNFDRRFVKATGNTPLEYLHRVKVEVAKNSLEKGRKTVSEVMDDVGYADDKSFREVFKKITGFSPMEYKGRFAKEFSRVWV